MNWFQCRMARAALSLGVRDVARLAEVSTNTVTRLEAGEEVKPATVVKIATALEALGLEFFGEDSGSAGVRAWRAPASPREASKH
jgi:transcriptional regulator with XRE-family HTH domain